MKIISSIREMQRLSGDIRMDGKSIGFVPTMGYLHDGHLMLVREARKNTDVVVASIFVNPTQFGPNEDYEKYPRDTGRDIRLLESAACDILFLPGKDEMYPASFITYVTIENMSRALEGEFRPDHFRGVATIVTKLFLAVKPHRAYFGQKDAQQCIVIRRMTADLNFDAEIVVMPTVREPDGLAMSSRNVYLSPGQRSDAPILYRALREGEAIIRAGEKDCRMVEEKIRERIQTISYVSIDYVAIVDNNTMEKITYAEKGKLLLIALAVRFGQTRLIDNIIFTV